MTDTVRAAEQLLRQALDPSVYTSKLAALDALDTLLAALAASEQARQDAERVSDGYAKALLSMTAKRRSAEAALAASEQARQDAEAAQIESDKVAIRQNERANRAEADLAEARAEQADSDSLAKLYHDHAQALRDDLAVARRALARAAFVAEHLLQMIDRETWREHGAEWQGQYEGDHHAEQVRQEIEDWKSLASLPGEPRDLTEGDVDRALRVLPGEPGCTCSPGITSVECPWHGGTI